MNIDNNKAGLENITIKEISFDEVSKIHNQVVEFKNENCEYFENRCKDKLSLKIGAYIGEKGVGYIVGYDRYNDNSFYCWMAGVAPEFRKHKVLTHLMKYQEKWALKNGFNKIKIKTCNEFRSMLNFLIKDNFNFTKVVEKENILRNKISLEKKL